ncbi:Vacuolar protein 8, partial [Coemansia sp. RSA 1933]
TPFVEAGLFDHMRAVLADPATSETVMGEMVAALSVFVTDESLWMYVLDGDFLELLVPLTRSDSYELQYTTCAVISTFAAKGPEASDRLVAVWDKPAGGLQSYLASFLVVDVGLEPTLRSMALWTVSLMLESDSPELVRLVIAHPSIIPNIEKLAAMGTGLSEGDARNSAYTVSGQRNSQAYANDVYDAEDMDENDDEIYNRIESLAQDIVALVNTLEF